MDACLREPVRVTQLCRHVRARGRVRGEQAHARHRREVPDHRGHRHRREQRIPDLGAGQPPGRHALAREAALADPRGDGRRVGERLQLLHRDDQPTRRILGRACRQLALDRPCEQPVVRRRRRARVREAKQITVRPAITRLVLRELEREVAGRLAVEPRAHRRAHAASPAPEALRVLGEGHQVRPDAADLREGRVGRAPRRLVTELGGHREGKDRRIVLGRTSRLGDSNDPVDGTKAVGGDAPRDAPSAVDRQLALGDVVGPALGAEDEEPVEARPVVERPRVAACRVRDLGGARNRLALRRDLGREQLGERKHDSLLPTGRCW